MRCIALRQSKCSIRRKHASGLAPISRKTPPPRKKADEEIRKIDFILNVLDTHAPVQQGFFEGLTPLPLVADSGEINEVTKESVLDDRFSSAKELDDIFRHADRVVNEIRSEMQNILPFEDVPFEVADIKRPSRMRFFFGYAQEEAMRAVEADPAWQGRFAWEVVPAGYLMRRGAKPVAPAKKTMGPLRVVAACLAEDAEAVRASLLAAGFEEISLPDVHGKVRDRIRELRADLAEYEGRLAIVASRAKLMSEWRRPLTILKAYWLSQRNMETATAQTAHGKWVRVVCGYVRERDLAAVENTLRYEFPRCSYFLCDPEPDEEVPVSLTSSSFVRPIQMLTEMFGLPNYRDFDPSPFMVANFYIFFGICFGDVGYGTMLVLLSLYLNAKTRPYRGVNNFARVLLIGGCSTIFFGLILGSWFGDLFKPEYLGENNLMLRLQETFVVLDPLAKTIVALVCALSIGILNQFYGIALKMYGAFRQGDMATALFDGLLWLITLPGIVILACTMFTKLPPYLLNIGMGLFFIGALGLVLTQGRDSKNIFLRLITGVTSIYGIVGSYGVTAFIGDTLSYCRLLALGLTTSIVAQTFNMMAGMLKETPVVGFFLFILVLVVGHIFNFMISLLGAFVHSMRLIFVEFFGRFYDGGAKPFRPLMFDSPLCIVKKPADTR